jgi:hypothetical protein|tara:strand:- start:45 stop:263 length:219 start_codon:yes stop_codon:yes gene_type:complete
MDKYTKCILTIIAIGIIGINVQLFKDDIITNANADVGGMNYVQLQMDYDFKKAVKKVISGKCYVDIGYVWCL